MKKIILSFGFFLFFTSFAYSQWTSNGKIVPDTEYRKAVSGFGAYLLITDKADELFSKWNEPRDPVPVRTTATVKRNETITVVLVFRGCKADSKGMCNATFDCSVLRPDKNIYADLKDVELWVNKPAPSEDQIELSFGNISIQIEPDDPLGVYEVVVKVKDHIANISFTLTQQFEVIE